MKGVEGPAGRGDNSKQEGGLRSIPQEVHAFVDTFTKDMLLDERPKIEVDGDTYEIQTNEFTLSFTLNIEDGRFEIRNIEARGLGNEIVEAIAQYADDNRLEVYASKIKDGSEGFWHKMGFEPSGFEGEFFRPEH